MKCLLEHHQRTSILDDVVCNVYHVFGARMFFSIISFHFPLRQLPCTFATNTCHTKYSYRSFQTDADVQTFMSPKL